MRWEFLIPRFGAQPTGRELVKVITGSGFLALLNRTPITPNCWDARGQISSEAAKAEHSTTILPSRWSKAQVNGA
jgi:hypothetical protein